MRLHSHVLLIAVVACAGRTESAEPVVLEQVVSRHDPAFDVARARLSVGQDGNVYLGNGHGKGGYVLRVSADGKTRLGGTVGYSFTAAAADKNGTLATAEAHFAHRAAFWTKDFAALGHVPDFLVSDAVQWNAPSDIVAGSDGFYAVDQHRLRVLKVVPPDKFAAAFSLEQLGIKSNGGSVGLRVDEERKRFLTAWSSGVIWCSAFDGKPLWNLKLRPVGETPGGFDLDAEGNLYVLPNGPETVQIFDRDGKKSGELKLVTEVGKKPAAIHDLRVLGDMLLVKRADTKTLFEAYDRRSGSLVRRVPADVEVLRAEYASVVWTAGRSMPFAIGFDSGPRPVKPRFRVFLRPLGVPEFTELAVKDGSIVPPADARGLYQVRVTPDIRGRYAEYTLDGLVEIRVPDSVGSVSILTPLNRFYYGAGEPIPVSVVVRTKPGTKLPAKIAVALDGIEGMVFTQVVNLTDGRGEFTVPASETKAMPPGRYRFDATVPGFTVAPQHIAIGPGLPTRPKFHIVQHGDYTLGFPIGPRPTGGYPGLFDLADTTQDHLLRAKSLRQNLFVDRLGHQSGLGELQAVRTDPALVERLKSDPLAIAPEKAAFEGPIRRTLGGYGANGIEEQGILLYMDAGLPVGTLFDNRKPEQMELDVRKATEAAHPYPSFRGWSWAANWWLEKHGAAAARDADEKKQYEAALKTAKETGAWPPVLDAVSDRTFAHAVDAEKRFRAAVASATTGLLSTMTGPYRAIQTHPPAIFANADEVDLHYQGEQIQPPQVTPHHVDFYKRPGKPAWGHPELWNDDGTGGMIFPTLLQMAMRGANGVGQSGPIGPWSGRDPTQSDPRSAAAGTTSAFRSAYELFHRYGPLLAATENADRVAIVVSTRMQRIETWDGKIGGSYFDALFEAYNACLYAHRPASFVFVEDLKPDTLKKYAAVLVVNQRVELDLPLKAGLAGAKVYHDGTCRAEVVKEFTPLGISFDRVKSDPSAWQDDAAYHRFPKYFQEHAAVLRKVLADVSPVARCSNPEIMLTERRAGNVRYVWAVNNTMLGWDPGLAWRVGLIMDHRVPVVEKLKLDVPDGATVLDLFAGKPAGIENGVVTCDLRTMPARVYAIVPKDAAASKFPAAVEDRFGPHVRDLALSADGKTMLLNAFNWDHNLYAVDVETGETKWRSKVGHAFAFDPHAFGSGFSAQGFDLHSAEGYHLYSLGDDGKPAKRFALFGLPKRATGWASGSQLQDSGINAFAASPAGRWVASAGDLGLVVWDSNGKELWTDEWWKTTRKRVRLIALDDDTLVVLDGTMASARAVLTGKSVWSLKLADTGSLRGGIVSADGKTLVVNSDAVGGRLFVIREGKVVNTLVAAADDLAISTDGSRIVATDGRQLKAYDSLGGLLWTYTGDDTLRHPRISPRGDRIAAGSELGTLIAMNADGSGVWEFDIGSLPVPAFLPNGDLLAATWTGKICRFDKSLRWERKLVPTETDAQAHLLAPDTTLTIRKTGWGNASPKPLPLTPNLLAETKVILGAVHDPKTHGDPLPWKLKAELLTDGKPEAPASPWLEWTEVGFVDSGWKSRLALEIDTFRTQLRVTGITFVEDPSRPESWLRDMRLQWWDATAEVWRDGPYLLSNSTTHSHVFEKPIEAARIRLISSGGGTWPIGNIRLGELVFHGEALGSSHPDAVAKRSVAVLFDEKETDLTALKYPGRPFEFAYTGAFSGGKCLQLTAAGETGPAYLPPFGHAIPNWDFEIAENPKPGQYRYLKFAWKATSERTTGMGLLLGRAWPGGGVAVTIGDAGWKEGIMATHKIEGKPSTEWREVTVDLWEATKGKPPRIQALNLIATGGGVAFDRLVLLRSLMEPK